MFWWIVGIFFAWIFVSLFIILCRAVAKERQEEAMKIAEGKSPESRRQSSPKEISAVKVGSLKMVVGDDDDWAEEKETIQKGNSIVGAYNDYVVVDVETTGGSPTKHRLLEVAAVRVRGGAITDKYNSLINPNTFIPEYISKKTNITNDMISDAPSIDSVIPRLNDFIGDDIIVAHNASFDVNFISINLHNITNNWLMNDFVDTLKLSRAIFSEHKTHKLDDLIKRFGIGESVEHRALSDAIQVQRCYEYIKDYSQKNNIDISNIDELKWHGKKNSAKADAGITHTTTTELSKDESIIINSLFIALKDVDVQIKTDRDSKNAMVISYFLSGERYYIQLGKIKFGVKSSWMSGYKIGNDSPAHRLNGGLPDFIKKIEEWAEAIKKHYATGNDIFKQLEYSKK